MSSAFSSAIDYLFGAAAFMPHGVCLAWRPDLLALHAVSDAVVAIAYFTIPLALVVFLRKRRDLEFRGVFAMFAAFILACGATHIMGLLTLWQPVYGLQGVVKAMTALVSIGTAAMVWPIIPRALALPSPGDLRRANDDLMGEINRRRDVERDLLRARDELEDRVIERTQALEHANAELRSEIERRERLESDLRQRERFLDTVFDNLPNIVFVKKAQSGTYTRINKAYGTMFNVEPEIVIGRTDRDVFVPEVASNIVAGDKAVIATGEPLEIPEQRIVTPAGQSLILHTRKILIPGENGETDYLLGISEDVTQQIANRDALVEAKESAELANRSKSEFLAHMSHELRTPLNSIMGFSQSITAEIFGPLGNARYVEYANDIQLSAEHLLAVINDILDIAKIEAKKDALSETVFDVASTLASAVAITKSLAAERSQSLSAKVDDNVSGLHADERMVRQVLVNLIGNAVKFTAPHGTIAVEASKTDDNSVAISVVDSGCGIPPDDIERVLRPFEQVRTESFHTHDGTGLGLSLSKTIVERHGGRLEIQSKVGVGTTVRAILPPDRNRARR